MSVDAKAARHIGRGGVRPYRVADYGSGLRSRMAQDVSNEQRRRRDASAFINGKLFFREP